MVYNFKIEKSRLYDSLICVQQKQHYDSLRQIEEKYETELKQKCDKINDLELTLESRLQTSKANRV